MQTHHHPAQPTGAYSSALHKALSSAPLVTSLTADLKKNTWTFQMDAGTGVRAGAFVLLDKGEAHRLVEAEKQAPIVTSILPLGKVRGRFISIGGDVALDIEDDDGCGCTLYRDFCGKQDGDFKIRHGVWWGSMTRQDSEGGRWSGQTKRYVQDDFGTLVEVPK